MNLQIHSNTLSKLYPVLPSLIECGLTVHFHLFMADSKYFFFVRDWKTSQNQKSVPEYPLLFLLRSRKQMWVTWSRNGNFLCFPLHSQEPLPIQRNPGIQVRANKETRQGQKPKNPDGLHSHLHPHKICSHQTQELKIKCMWISVIETVRLMQPVSLTDLQLAAGSP